jgi:hypothetical protein
MKILFLDLLYWNYLVDNPNYNFTLGDSSTLTDLRYPSMGIGKPLAEALLSVNIEPIHLYLNAPYIYNSNKMFSGNHKKILGIEKLSKAVLFSQGLKLAIEQMKIHKPDVVWIFCPRHLPPIILDRFKRYTKLLVGHLSSTEPRNDWLNNYDLLMTSHPGFVLDWRKKYNKPVELFKPAFQEKYASKTSLVARKHKLVFAGKLSSDHEKRIEVLQDIIEASDIEVYADISSRTRISSSLKKVLKPPKWGEEYFKLLGDSSIILNVHGEIAGNFSANIRMVEASGAGGLLVTEKSSNLHEYFDSVPIPTYENSADLLILLGQLTKNLNKYQEIATRSQQIVLNEHSYTVRAKEALEMLSKII